MNPARAMGAVLAIAAAVAIGVIGEFVISPASPPDAGDGNALSPAVPASGNGGETWVEHTVRELPEGVPRWYRLQHPQSWELFWQPSKGFQLFSVTYEIDEPNLEGFAMVDVASTTGDVNYDLALPVREEVEVLSQTPATIGGVETTLIERGVGSEEPFTRIYDAEVVTGTVRYHVRQAIIEATDQATFDDLKASTEGIVSSLAFLPGAVEAVAPADAWVDTWVEVPWGTPGAGGAPTAVSKYVLHHPPGWVVGATAVGGVEAAGQVGSGGTITIRVQPTGIFDYGDLESRLYLAIPEQPFGMAVVEPPTVEALAPGERRTYRIVVNSEELLVTIDLPVGPGDPAHLRLDQAAWRVITLSGLQPAPEYVHGYP